MDEGLQIFINHNPDAAMITQRADGTAHVARIEVAVVEGRLWGSGAPMLVRTHNVRRDPRSSLFVFAPPPNPRWVGLETVVTILDGPDVPNLLVRFMRVRHGDAAPAGMILGHDDVIGHDRPYSEDEYVEHVRDERRLIYEFNIRRTYGNY